MNEFSNMKQKLLAEQVQEQIYRYMKEQNYQIGDKMPNEYELASLFSVGRSTIREAVKLLASKGLLEVRRGSGTFVSSKLGMSDDPLGLSMICDKDKLVMDLLEVRLLIVPKMAALAAEHATAGEFSQLKDIWRRLEGG